MEAKFNDHIPDFENDYDKKIFYGLNLVTEEIFTKIVPSEPADIDELYLQKKKFNKEQEEFNRKLDEYKQSKENQILCTIRYKNMPKQLWDIMIR